MTANECYRLSTDAQLRYTVQWFDEWSEMQRDDFLPILTSKLRPDYISDSASPGSYSHGGPPSLFKCRAKLFSEWIDTWSQTQRDQLLGHIKSMDPDFHTRLEELLGTPNGKVTQNGHAADDDAFSVESLTEATEEVIAELSQQALPDVIAPVVNSNSAVNDDGDVGDGDGNDENGEQEVHVEPEPVEVQVEQVEEAADASE